MTKLVFVVDDEGTEGGGGDARPDLKGCAVRPDSRPATGSLSTGLPTMVRPGAKVTATPGEIKAAAN